MSFLFDNSTHLTWKDLLAKSMLFTKSRIKSKSNIKTYWNCDIKVLSKAKGPGFSDAMLFFFYKLKSSPSHLNKLFYMVI